MSGGMLNHQSSMRNLEGCDEPAPATSPWTSYSPQSYLATFYSGQVEPDEQIALHHQIEFMGRLGPWNNAVEVGCGPTLQRAIAAAPYVSNIDLIDVNSEALDCILRWRDLKSNAHDWSRFSDFLVGREPYTAEFKTAAEREQLTRTKIRSAVATDIRLGELASNRYDFLLSAYCLECCYTDVATWRLGVKNLFSMIRPGGALFLVSLIGCQSCRIADDWYPCCALSTSDVKTALLQNGCAPNSIRTEEHESSAYAPFGWSRFVTASAIVSI